MFCTNEPKPVPIGEGKHVKATGFIKKVFPKKPEPYGFLLLLTPLDRRGQEASFFCSDVKAPADERENLRVGMQMEFNLIDKPEDNMKSQVDYKAVELIPQGISYYQAVVVRAADDYQKMTRVALDLTLEQVKITPASFSKLKPAKSLKMGDPCVIRLTWNEMVNATKEARVLEGDIVSACRLEISADGFSDGTETETEGTVPSSEDSLPTDSDSCPPSGKPTPRKPREPVVRSKPPMPTTPKKLNPYEPEYRYETMEQEPRCCPAPCCQDMSQNFPAQAMPPYPFPAFNALCSCAGCLIMRQNYAMIPPGYLSYPMDVGSLPWEDMDGC